MTNGTATKMHNGCEEYLIFSFKNRAFPMAMGKDRGEFYLTSLWNDTVWAASRNLANVLEAISSQGTDETAG